MFSKSFLVSAQGLLLAILVGCGGGGGNPGTPSGGNGAVGSTNPAGTSTSVVATPTLATPTAVISAADFIFELDKQSISSAGADKALLSVLAVDSNRNVVANVPVSVAVDSGGVFSSVGVGGATNSAGQFSGNISIGGNKTNRIIKATISVSGIVKTASIQVVGSQVSFTPVPATPAPGQAVTLNLESLDSAGASVPSVVIALSGSSGISASSTTDLSGKATVSFNAPSTPGIYSIVGTGLGVTTNRTIQVISPSGGSFPAAVGVVSSVSLSPQPSSIAPNQVGATANRAKLTARFLTPSNVGLQNMRVRFEILPPALGAGEALSTGASVVYSDAAGVAESEYISGTRSSPTNGVLLRACYKATDFTSATECPNSVVTTFTVAGTPLSISISDDNTISKGLGAIAYLKKYLIQVNDASGVAVKDAIVSVSVDITHYGKGRFSGANPLGDRAPNISDSYVAVSGVGQLIVGAPAISVSPGTVTLSNNSTTFANVWCVNEDTNRNGSLDGGEDVNGDGVLQPRKADVVVSYVSGNTTDVNGQLLVQATYGQSFGSWLSYTLRATTRVGGSEGDASKSYITGVAKEDLPNGSFLTPPYGSSSCDRRD